jgi:RNA polymerase sigma factor (sigma-70 family)
VNSASYGATPAMALRRRGGLAGTDEEGFELVETRDAVSRGLHRFTKRDSQVLYMRFYEDLTQAEIAARVGLSQMQVSRIIRSSLEPSRWRGELQPV